MSISQNFPAIRPTLSLNFARSKILDPRITFTRASTATYVDREGLVRTAVANQARFDHNPITGESLGLLIEESRVNYYIYSGNLSNNYWNHSNLLITANSTTSPDGTITATLLVPNTTNAVHRITPNVGVTTSYNTVSFFVKSAGYRYIMVRGDNQSNFHTFDIIDGIITGQNSLNSSIASIQDYNNGWYRCVLSYIPATTANDPEIFFANTSDYNAANFSGNGIDGAYFWGAQLEVGSFPTSYIPTSGSAVTRSADLASISGSSFSNFYNPVEGTAYIDLISNGVNADGAAFQVYFNFNSDDSNRWGIGHQNESRGSFASNAVLPYVGQAGVFDVLTRFSKTFVPGSRNKYAMTQPNGSDVKIIGTGTGGFTSGITSKVPATSQLYLGQVISDNGNLNGTIAEFRYYPQELTPDQITTLIK